MRIEDTLTLNAFLRNEQKFHLWLTVYRKNDLKYAVVYRYQITIRPFNDLAKTFGEDIVTFHCCAPCSFCYIVLKMLCRFILL